jgi:hypothetical protein
MVKSMFATDCRWLPTTPFLLERRSISGLLKIDRVPRTRRPAGLEQESSKPKFCARPATRAGGPQRTATRGVAPTARGNSATALSRLAPDQPRSRPVLMQRLSSTEVTTMKKVTLDANSSATFTVRLHHGPQPAARGAADLANRARLHHRHEQTARQPRRLRAAAARRHRGTSPRGGDDADVRAFRLPHPRSGVQAVSIATSVATPGAVRTTKTSPKSLTTCS